MNEILDPVAENIIKRTARRMRTRSDGAVGVEDIEQELRLQHVVAQKLYDPTKSSRATFTTRVCQNRASTLAEALRAKKRCPRSAPPPRSPTAGDRERDAEVIDISDLLALERENERLSDLERDVAKAEARLPREQWELCQHLKNGTISDAAMAIGKSRSWVYEQIEKMRPHFEKQLRDEALPDTFAAPSVCHRRR